MSIMNKKASISSLSKIRSDESKSKNKSDLYLMYLRHNRYRSINIDQEIHQYEKTLNEIKRFDRKSKSRRSRDFDKENRRMTPNTESDYRIRNLEIKDDKKRFGGARRRNNPWLTLGD